MKNRRTFLRMTFILAVFAALNFLRWFTRPELNIRTVDTLHLIGAGMCLGGAIVALVGYYLTRPSS
jgi:hypothetical protein